MTITKVENKLSDSNIEKEKQKAKVKEISQAPKELIDESSGCHISQSKLIKLSGESDRKIRSWTKNEENRPEWFDEYIEVRIESEKRVMYRR